MKRQADKRIKGTEKWKRRDSDVEYKRFSVQEKTGEEVSEPISWSIYY